MKLWFAVLCLPVGLLMAAGSAAQDASTYEASPPPAQAAPASDGGNDLSATTSQTGSTNQPNWNLMTSLSGADVLGPNEEHTADLRDVLIDHSGQITHFVVEPAGLGGVGADFRLLEARNLPTLPSGQFAIELDQAALDQLPVYDAAELPRQRSAGKLLGVEIEGTSAAAIEDIRFSADRIDRIILDIGGSAGFNKILEVPFTELLISGPADEPSVGASEDVLRRIGTLRESRE